MKEEDQSVANYVVIAEVARIYLHVYLKKAHPTITQQS